jgi:hypothetical protein
MKATHFHLVLWSRMVELHFHPMTAKFSPPYGCFLIIMVQVVTVHYHSGEYIDYSLLGYDAM